MLEEDHYTENNSNSNNNQSADNNDNNNSSNKSIRRLQPFIHPSTVSLLSKIYKNHHCFWSSAAAAATTTSRHHQRLLLRSSSSGNHSHSTVATLTKRRHNSCCTPSFKPSAMRRLKQQQGRHSSRISSPLLLPPNALSPPTLPPINYDTLKELSVHHIFKSLQLRHDLFFDANLSFRPNIDGSSGREKKKCAEKYWRHLDHSLKLGQFDCLKPVLKELKHILISMMNPFEGAPASGTSFMWMWPNQVTRQHVEDALDSDLIIQQLKYGGALRMDWLSMIFKQLINNNSRLEMMKKYFLEGRYANALKQCFYILELIKLDCANRVIRHYRAFLLETCAEFEYKCFIKQKDLALDSVSSWLSKHSVSSGSFLSVYHAGLVHLVTEDSLLQQQFPVTLQFDQKRLTQTFRYEFQNTIVMSILLVPYRHLTGRNSKKADMDALKQLYTYVLLKERNNNCYQLASHACQLAYKRNAMFNVEDQTKFWENWLNNNLKPTASIFQLMHDRFSKLLVYCVGGAVPGDKEHQEEVMDEQIQALGKKIKMVADLNLETFGAVYKSIFASCK